MQPAPSPHFPFSLQPILCALDGCFAKFYVPLQSGQLFTEIGNFIADNGVEFVQEGDRFQNFEVDRLRNGDRGVSGGVQMVKETLKYCVHN